MYLEHFGLQRQPFKITPDTSMFYTGNKRGAALEALKYAIISGEGIIKVVGEVGAGKTMLCRMLEVELADNIEVVYIANPSLSPDNILHVIAFELKLSITSDSSKLEVMQALQNYLLDKHANNNQVVVFVEEAQSMPIETLEEIRLLSNLETNDHKLLQMVLFGQPELDDKLRMPSIRQLKERITHNFYLDPFPAADVYSYLNFRMRAVGYRGPDLFTPKTANNIERKSNGLTRRINILADKALLAAFSDGGHDISTKHIDLAAKDSDFGQEFNWLPVFKIVSGVSIVLCSIWIGTLLPAFLNSSAIKSSHLPSSTVPFSPASPTLAPSPIETSIKTNTETEMFIPAKNKALAQNLPTQINPQVLPVNTNNSASTNLLLHQRLQQTQNWLKEASNENLTIQLIILDVGSDLDVNRYLEKAGQVLNTQSLYVYQTSIRGRMVYSVLYSEYTQREQAISQLQKLSPWLRKSRPYLRKIYAIRADIRQTQNHIGLSDGAKH